MGSRKPTSNWWVNLRRSGLSQTQRVTEIRPAHIGQQPSLLVGIATAEGQGGARTIPVINALILRHAASLT